MRNSTFDVKSSTFARMGAMLIESLTIDTIAEFVDRSDVAFFAHCAVNPHNIGICSFLN